MDSNILVIAGGGTGGHVLAGVAVADEWKAKAGKGSRIVFVGAEGGIEEKLVPRAGYPLELLKLGSLNRVSLSRRIRTTLQLPFSLLRSLAILLSTRPHAVLGVGGYASGPLLLMARILSSFGLIRCRTAILEQNSVPGFTNRILGKVVGEVFCAFPGTEKQFARSRPILTGNPVRSSMKRLPPAPRDPFTVFIFGGSQGALGINSMVLEAIPHLNDLNTKIRFIHQTGENDYERVLKGHQAAGTQARVEKFIHEMAAAYSEASLLVCRAGSSTLAEISAVGRAAILVPFPFASDNHQQKNAEVFVNAGAALLLTQAVGTGTGSSSGKGKYLAELIRELIASPEKLDAMETAVTRFYKPYAAQEIVRELMT